MQITQIHSESDYQIALARIEELWTVTPDDPEFKELVYLLNLLETFETLCNPEGRLYD